MIDGGLEDFDKTPPDTSFSCIQYSFKEVKKKYPKISSGS